MSVLKKYNTSTSQWEAVVVGKQGNSGTVAVTAPITNTGTTNAAVLGIDPNYLAGAAGKNVVINGGFDIWQRGTSVSGLVNGYGADRWWQNISAAWTISKQTTGAPIGSQSYGRVTWGATGIINTYQIIETLNTAPLWGKVVTFSVKIRRNSTLNTQVRVLIQKSSTVDASGGSTWVDFGAEIYVQPANLPTGTTSSDWYTATVTTTIPNDGTANTIRVGVDTWGSEPSGSTLDIAQAQLEAGATASNFSRAGGTIQGELAACQRYYIRFVAGSASGNIGGYGWSYISTAMNNFIDAKVTMRALPTSVDWGGALQIQQTSNNTFAVSAVALNSGECSTNKLAVTITHATATANLAGSFRANADANAYVGFSAEL